MTVFFKKIIGFLFDIDEYWYGPIRLHDAHVKRYIWDGPEYHGDHSSDVYAGLHGNGIISYPVGGPLSEIHRNY